MKKTARRDRVTLDPVSVARLDQWISELNEQLRGVKISRSDLINFIINDHPLSLDGGELQKLRKLYFDEADFAEWALREFRKAKGNGEMVSLADMLKPVFPTISRQKRRKSSEKPCDEADPNPGKKGGRVL